MKIWKWSVVAVAVAVAGACKTAPTPAKPAPPADPAPVEAQPAPPPADALPAVPSSPIAEPEAVLVHAQVGDLPAFLPRVGAFTDAIRPGGGMMFTLDFVRMGAAQAGIDLSGVDLARPVHLLLLDPTTYGGTPVVLVVAVADRPALDAMAQQANMVVMEHGGFAALGTRQALGAVGPYALSTLVTRAPAAAPRIEIAVGRGGPLVRDQFASAVQQMVDQAPPEQRSTMEVTMRGYVSLLDQIDRATFVLDADAARGSLEIHLTGKPGTTLERFIGQQRPGSFELLRELPPSAIVMGGSLQLDPLWDFMIEVSKTSMQQVYGDAEVGTKLMEQWRTLLVGENAVGAELGKDFRVSALWDITQRDAVAAMWRDYFQTVAKTPLTGKMNVKLKLDAGKHRGAKLSTMTTSPTKQMTAEERLLYDFLGGALSVGYAVTGDRLLIAGGADGLRGVKDALDRNADKARAFDPPVGAVITELKQRRESYLVAFDLVGIRDFAAAQEAARAAKKKAAAPPRSTRTPVILAIGASTAGALTFRIAVPAEQIAPLM